MESNYYFLFGSDACRILLEDGQESLLSWLAENTEFAVVCYNEYHSTPEELLDAYDGWRDYLPITKELYNIISNL